MIRKDVTVGINSVYGVNALYVDNGYREKVLLALTFLDRSKTLSKSIVGGIVSGYPVRIGYLSLSDHGFDYGACFKPVRMGRDRFTLTTVINKSIGKRFLLTDAAHLHMDTYNYLMLNYRLPLLTEWMGELLKALEGNGNISLRTNCCWKSELAKVNDKVPGIELHGCNVPVEDVIVIDFQCLSETNLSETVTSLIQSKVIKVCDAPNEEELDIQNFDSYIKNYGATLVNNLEKEIETLSPLNGELDGFAARTKRLYPQQAACVNGMIALKNADSQYGLMIEGMGCGKTMQGASVVDAYFNQKWLKEHKGKDLKDLYMAEDQPKYRNVLMAPSHLVEKWKEEITSEIPGTEVHIINDFDSLLELRKEGKARRGREWYLISKDFAKLGSFVSPIPTTVAKMVPKAAICSDCYHDEEKSETVYRTGTSKTCGGRHFEFIEMPEYGKKKGLVCPKCGNLLLRPAQTYTGKDGTDKEKGMFLTPADFASHTTWNDVCTLCGEHLWGVDCKPIGTSQEEDAKKRKWYKVSHYKNHQKKGRTTAFVLKGYEKDYTLEKQELDIQKSPVEYGPRRYAPSLFIKKYLKGYFDFCILDEAHKYEAGGSAQSIAAHALMKASDFTLCLTGTITNGKADSLFYLLYMLDPRRMNKRGYKYSDVMNFVRNYGCIETAYEVEEGQQLNSMSRGKQKGSPKIKPGISPLIFTDFLLDKAVFLDLSDLSSYLPPLKEQVVICNCPEDVKESYEHVLSNLKSAAREKGGRSVLSSMLQFGLSYTDKPYGFKSIMHPKFKDTIITNVPSNDIYADGTELLPKEEKLIDIVNDEISQDRNVFVYCAYTGSEEMNITTRLLTLIEDRCNLKGQVLVMGASNPKATERERFIRQKASEGIKVFICNMKLVETGLDFCFKYNGANYNYPTIIFYQLTYELAVMWQASRRHYRLNQREECHTYYMATEGTVQQAAVQIMAEKQVAASAIQGKFSVDGLASMAKGVDPRLKLAQMLADEDDGMDRKSLENMFDVMNASNASGDDERYSSYVPPKTFYEIMGGEKAAFEKNSPKAVTEVTTVVDTSAVEVTDIKKSEETKTTVTTKVTTTTKTTKTKKKTSGFAQISIFDVGVKLVATNKDLLDEQLSNSKSKKKPKKALKGQLSLFDLVAA